MDNWLLRFIAGILSLIAVSRARRTDVPANTGTRR